MSSAIIHALLMCILHLVERSLDDLSVRRYVTRVMDASFLGFSMCVSMTNRVSELTKTRGTGSIKKKWGRETACVSYDFNPFAVSDEYIRPFDVRRVPRVARK